MKEENLGSKKTVKMIIKNNAVILSNKDNVSVALCELKAGDTANFNMDGKSCSITVKEDVPAYHKISICSIKEGTSVYKYGQTIGKATCDIEPGQHVHSHNLISIREYIV